MNTFNTKYKSCSTTIDELQYVSQGDTAPNPFKDNAPREKQANYSINIIKAVSGGKYINFNQQQLTGKGVLSNKKIYNETHVNNNSYEDAASALGIVKNYSKKRTFKKNNIIYDLLY
tara:strand:+ start:1506 stop:1856 length:351 start_codon:yes stop_codon:yes gene_type:complete